MRIKHYLMLLLLFMSYFNLYSQNAEPFVPARYNERVRGDILLVGNNILSIHPTNSYNDTGNASGSFYNDDVDMVYVDVDNDASTFSSSSAILQMPNTSRDCYRIQYAALYWSATYKSGDRTNLNRVKFKVPGSSTYTDITGSIIYDEGVGNQLGNSCKPYAAFADVTSLLTPSSAEGTYTVANITASLGNSSGCPGGNAGGWSLFVVYEDPKLPGKFITTFDGFTGINGTNTQTIPISGFNTNPTGNVYAKLAFSALEGDNKIPGDGMQIRGVNTTPTFSNVTSPSRPTTNFFNSSFTDVNGNYINRTPASQNTLGYDGGVTNVDNPGRSVLGNNETQAEVRINTTGDQYYLFFLAFSVEIIEPSVVLTKAVEDNGGRDIGNQNVTLCQELNYRIGFDNIGNDDAEGLNTQPAPYGSDYVLVRDVLPNNVTLVSYDTTNVPGTIVVVNPTNPRDLSFYVPKRFFTVAETRHEILIKVRVACSCPQLADACSNVIQNQAFITYQGVVSDIVVTNDPSLSQFDPTCLIGVANSTNFLVGIDTCNFTSDVYICGNSVTLTAANNYDTYTWTGPVGSTITVVNPTPTGTTPGQVVTVNRPGTYTVNGNDAQCRPIVQTFNVIQYGSSLTNPIIPYDESPTPVQCADNGERVPYIYLCGSTDTQLLQTNITDAIRIEWFLYNEASCGAYPPTNCPVTTDSCWSNLVGSGSNYTVTQAGKYRVVFTFEGGCNRTFYFNVYQNLLDPQVVAKNIICGTPGSITVNNVPNAGYQFQLLNGATVVFPWQSSNIFTPINTAGNYTVQVRPTAFSGGCVFSVPNIGIQVQNVTVTAQVTQPLCYGQFGEVNLGITGVPGQYYFILHQGPTTAGPIVGSAGPTNLTYHVFSNLNPGQTYTWETRTDDGCNRSGTFTINNPSQLNITSSLTRPLTTCGGPGEITVNASGGTPPYYYYLNSAPPAPFLTSNVIPVSSAGTYNITVYDSNNCTATTAINVVNVPDPVYNVTSSNVLCYGANTGSINFNVTNTNGFTLGYSITGGAPFGTNPSFTNLSAGTYTATLQYTLGSVVCTKSQTITITGPANALTASGGVAAVACDSNGGNGIVRITNVQGGTPYPAPNFYQYNFGSGYQNSNQANLPPGTYTISVRDANLCEYFMTVTLDPIPAPPTINVGTPVFNCNGTATSTVTVNNGASSYTYTYSINPPLVPPHNPNSNVFQNVPCGNSVVTVNYTLVSPPTFSNLLREDFGSGPDTTSPGINTNYCFERQINDPALYCRGSAQINDGDYSVTKRILFPFGAWYNNFRDHTSNGTDPNGRFLAINIGGVAGVGGILYTKPIADIIPNQDIKVSLWAANLLKIDPSNTQSPPNLTVQLVKDLGLPSETVIQSVNTGDIPKTNTWNNYLLTLNPGSNTSLNFVVRSNIAVTSGNDVVIDDIEVYQLPVSCLTTRNFPINIPCNQAFTAQVTGHRDVSCAGANDGTITIAAQNYNTTNGYQISMDNGATWLTQFTSPVTINVPVGYPGFVLVRYDATPGNSACSFNLPQPIITPTTLLLNVNSTLATCLTGATITASAAGGTPAYQYQLENSVGTIIYPYQTSSIFSNIAPGNYVVRVRDFNGCTTASATVNIASPLSPTISVSSADFCYDGTNAASLTVTASGGNAPYEYSINGGAFQTSNVFNNLTPGSYTITVRDSFGCTASTTPQVINPQLTATAALTKDLDCTASPDAVITVNIAGGYPGYGYQVSINGGAYTPATPTTTGTPFTYSVATVATPTTYQFQITDSRGCITTTNVITVNPLIPIASSEVVTNVLCNGASNGVVTITPSGGVGPYQINFNGLGFSNQTTYSGLAAGTYNYIVRDSKSCTRNFSVTISQPSALSATAALTTPYTCTTNGVITVTVTSNGTGSVQYSINGGTTWQASNVFGGLTAGTYTIIVRDANGCTATVTPSITIAPLTPPTNLTVTPLTTLTCPSNTINVQVTATGGSPGLTYQITAPAVFATSNTTGIFNGIRPNITYTFQITDSKNCTYSENFIIAPLAPVTAVSQVLTNVRCLGGNEGSAQITVGGFGSGYSYTVTGPAFSSGSGSTSPITLTNLVAGNYIVNVTNTTTNCSATTSFTIAAPSAALTATLSSTPVTCTGNGSITVNASGGWGGYTYSISPSVGTLSGNVFNNVPAGSYTITITDANGCTITRPITLNSAPVPSISVSSADFCYDGTNAASITVSATGGTAPYQYSVNGGAYQSSNVFNNLTPGSYTFTVIDSFGCTDSTTPQVINPQLTATAVLTKDLDCTASPDAVITVNIAGGYPGYGYQVSMNGGAYTPVTPTSTGSPFTYTISTVATATTYQFQITDSRGCIATTNIITVNPLIPIATTEAVTNVLCNGASTGVVTITPSGGVGPYEINFNGLGFSSQTTYSGLSAGTYNYIIRDSKSCTLNESVTITQPTEITAGINIVPIQCNVSGGSTLGQICVTGDTSGATNIPVTGGTPQYTYTLVDLTGGTPNQTYTTTAGESHCFTNIDYGLYDVIITDANGCTKVFSNINMISQPVNASISSSVTAGTCTAGATITLNVLTLIGSGNYFFSLFPNSNPPETFPGSGLPNTAQGWFGESAPDSYTFTGLQSGISYNFIIWDSVTQCYYYHNESVPAATNSNIVISAITPANVTCTGSSNGNTTFTFSGYQGTAVNYEIRNDFTNAVVLGPVSLTGLTGTPVTVTTAGSLPPGSYYIYITEANGPVQDCSVASPSFTITESVTILSISASVIKNDNCFVNAGVIDIVGSGGTAPYTYQILTSGSPAPTSGSAGWVSTSSFNLESGNYDAYVKDANGCIQTVAINLPLDPNPTVSLPTLAADQCTSSGTSYTFTATGSGVAPLSYSIDGVSFQSSPTFTVSSPGTYTVTIKDGNNCTATATITIYPPVTLSATITTITSCANNDGVITVAGSGGTGNYSYTQTSPAGPTNTTGIFTGLSAGTYTFTVTDTTTNCTATVTETLDAATPVTFDAATVTNVSCNGGSDGTITVNLSATNDNPPYTYAIIAGPVTFPAQSSNVFSGLPQGSYTIEVVSGRNCRATQIVPVTQPSVVVASASASIFTCASDNSVQASVITVTGSGGTPGTLGYTYSIDGINYTSTNTFNVVDNGSVQNITVYVKDSNGCIDTDTVTINPIIALTGSITVAQAIDCTRSEIITLNAGGGTGSYTYSVIPAGAANVVAGPGVNQFTISAPGSYTFQITDATTGCYLQLTHDIPVFNNINATLTAISNVLCFGDANGSLSLNVQGYTGAYSYSVIDQSTGLPLATHTNVAANTSTNPVTIIGLPTGTYTVSITELAYPQCSYVTPSATIGSPAAALSLIASVIKNDNCFVNAGVIDIVGSGGTAPYTYQILTSGSPAPTSGSAGWVSTSSFNLESGNYDAYVKDANGCIQTVAINLPLDPNPTVSLPTLAADQCTSSGTSYTFTATGTGVAPLSYSFDGVSFQGSPTFTVSSPGTYTVTIKDGNNCTATATITIYPPVTLSATITTITSCANNDGVITVAGSGGTGNYSYTQTTPAGPTNTTGIFTGLSSGTYTFTVTDTTTNCTATVTETLDAATPVTFDAATVTNVSCNGGSDGTITVNLSATNDNPPYTYAIIAGPVTFPAQSSNVFSGLPLGSYTIEVVSGRNCRATQIVPIIEPNSITVPAPLVTQFACNSGTNSPNLATITVNGVTGGSGMYTIYEFILGGTVVQSSSSPVYNTSNTAGGSYTINVYDDKNCVGSTTAIINPFISISNPVVTVTSPITCTTLEDITVTVTTTGGTAPTYNYNVTSIPAGAYNVTNTTGVFTGLSIGDYMVTVTNPVTNCSVQAIHYVFDPNTFDVITSGITNVSCINGNTGSVVLTFVDNQLNPTNDAGPFNYTITNTTSPLVINGTSATAGPTAPITGLTAGVYNVTATLVNAPTCTVTTSFTILQPSQALDLNGSSTPITCTPGNDGTITVQATGGWLGYTYSISPAVGNQTAPGVFENLSPNNYTVTVTDALGCQDTFVVNLLAPQPITGRVDNVQLRCFGVNDGVATAYNVTGGQNVPGNYIYTLNYVNPTGASSGPQSSPTFSNLAPGSYNILITDPLNCQTIIPFTVLPANEIFVTLSKVNDSQVCDTSFEQLLLSATGGTGSYQYSTSATGPWTNFVSPLNLGSLPVGQYTYYVRDTNNCAAVASNRVDILQVPTLGINPIADIELDCSYATATITAKAFGGEGNYIYTLLPSNISNNTGIFTNVSAGNYTIRVTSGDCSTVQTTVTVTSPTEFTYTIVPQNTSCSDSNDGSVTITTQGSAGRPVQYQLLTYNAGGNVVINTIVATIPDPTVPFTITNLVGNRDYEIRVFTLPSGCTTPDQRFEIRRPLAVSAIVTPINEQCAEDNIGEIRITNITGGTPPYTVSYTSNSTVTPSGSATLTLGQNQHTFDLLDGGRYNVVITDSNGCPRPYVINIDGGVDYMVDAVKVIECVDDSNTQRFVITVINKNNANGQFLPDLSGYTFTLDGVVNNNSPKNVFSSDSFPSLLVPGQHTIIVSHANGCVQPQYDFVIEPSDIDPLILQSFIPSPNVINTVIADISNLDGSLSGTGPYTFEFQTNGRYTQSGPSNTYVYYESGWVTVKVTDANGCVVTGLLPVVFEPICIPDVLTPDGNGENDDWGPGCVDPTVYPRLVTLIYDRYGRLVATLPVGSRWNGKYDGKDLPTGDYWYVVKVDKNDGQQFVGHFTLYR
jgi:large repetitive protein